MTRPRPRHPYVPRRERSLDRLAELVLALPPERRAVLERDLREGVHAEAHGEAARDGEERHEH